MVHADSYRVIRELRDEDIPELLGMIGRVVRRTKLIARTYEDIQARIGDYCVMSIDDNVVGCVALHEYPSENCAEIACLYVKQAHEGRGYGFELVKHAESLAKQKRNPSSGCFNEPCRGFFTRADYALSDLDALPEKRREQFIASGRDSLVFQKFL